MRKNQRLISAEQLSANGRSVGQAGTFENRSRAGKIGGPLGSRNAILSGNHMNFQRVKCPHCDKVSTPGGMGNHLKKCNREYINK